jgi:hypothetical protein
MKHKLIRFLRRHGYTQHGRVFNKNDIRVTFKQRVVRMDRMLTKPIARKVGDLSYVQDCVRLSSVYYGKISFDEKGIPNGFGFHSYECVADTMKLSLWDKLKFFLFKWAR